MRAFWSYGIALLIILGIAVWMGTGTIVNGGRGPGQGERPAVSLVESNGGPLTDAVKGVAPDTTQDEADSEMAAKTIADRNADAGSGTDASPRSVRIEVSVAKLMPIEVPLRGRTDARSSVKVAAQTSGTVEAVKVEKGQTVKAGDVMCQIDQGARSASVAQAEAALAQAQVAFDSNASLRAKGLAAPNTQQGVEANLAAAKAAVENARLELDRTEVKAPIDGVVQGPLAEVGSMLAAGQPCASLVQLDPMLFTANVPEAKMAYARVGLKAKVTTISGQTADGKVTYVASIADPATRSFPIEIELPNPDGKILSGVTADAVVNVGTAPVHVLPQSVLTLNDDGVLGIRTVNADNTVAFHAVNIIKDTRDGVWIVGLPPKLNVITVGQEYVKPGQVVDARTADGENAS
jgi:multidrug efflux system membrane fusion protein